MTLTLLHILAILQATSVSAETVTVEEVLGPITFKTTDGRVVTYWGVQLPPVLASPESDLLKASLREKHAALIPPDPLTVHFRKQDSDTDERLQAIVIVDDELLNVRVLRQGLAQVDPVCRRQLGAHEDLFMEAQFEAGSQRKGLWSDPLCLQPVIASKRSGKVHLPFCPWATRISKRSRQLFSDVADATSAGMARCKVCLKEGGFEEHEQDAVPSRRSRPGPSALTVLLLVFLLLAGIVVYARGFPRSVPRFRRDRSARPSDTDEPEAKRKKAPRRPPPRKDCDFSELMPRLHQRWSSYLPHRDLTWRNSPVPKGCVLSVPESEVKALFTGVLVYLRDRLPGGSEISTVTETEESSIAVTISVRYPEDTEAPPPPSADDRRRLSGLAASDAVQVGEVGGDKEGSDGQRQLLLVRLPLAAKKTRAGP